ncbi:hypothetical protein, partial [Allofournierella massiliensis]|uniref:hypothetical protein n=1 Tax=Allofournierella massiliensis TaxID=1650663 RepID=UPI0035656DBE
NEIGNPFGEVYLIFFILGYFATAPFSFLLIGNTQKKPRQNPPGLFLFCVYAKKTKRFSC